MRTWPGTFLALERTSECKKKLSLLARRHGACCTLSSCRDPRAPARLMSCPPTTQRRQARQEHPLSLSHGFGLPIPEALSRRRGGPIHTYPSAHSSQPQPPSETMHGSQYRACREHVRPRHGCACWACCHLRGVWLSLTHSLARSPFVRASHHLWPRQDKAPSTVPVRYRRHRDSNEGSLGALPQRAALPAPRSSKHSRRARSCQGLLRTLTRRSCTCCYPVRSDHPRWLADTKTGDRKRKLEPVSFRVCMTA